MIRALFSLLIFTLSFTGSYAAKPNVVILLADDLGYQDVGCYGGPVKTPAIDQLAAGGARFTDFYSGCAVCSPSRAVLLTGRHHIRAGVYSWIHDESQNSHLLEREVTIAEHLRAAGYNTAHVGKWHLGLPTKKRQKPTPDQHGFDHWFATWNNAQPSHKNPNNFIRNGEPVGQLEGYSCQLVVDEAIDWLDTKRDKDKPFFLNVWFHEPHAPIAAPDEVVESYGELKDKAAIYSGTIDNTDKAIARLFEKLKKVAPAEETLIIYASDNGSYRDDRTGGLRGRKGSNWEGGIRVPGIFNWPGKIPAEKVLPEPAGITDILPTICGLLDISPPEEIYLDGSDLSPLLLGNADFTRHQPLFWHLQKSRPIVAMRDGDFSLVAEPDYELSTKNMFNEAWIPMIKSGTYKNFQLFDLREDPQQKTDLAEAQPERLAELKAKLLKINESVMADGYDWHLRGTHNTLTEAEEAEGWKLLFDGETIKGFRGYDSPEEDHGGWVIDSETLHKPADIKAGNIMTVDTYEDFEFSWEWKLEKNGNNGVKYFITEARGAAVGHEYQMLDDARAKDAFTSTASFYLIAKPAADKPLRAPGEWNQSRILVRGDDVEHWLNGKKVLEYKCGSPEVMERVPQTKFKKYPGFGKKVAGHILLTDHKDPCWYRNLKIRELEK